MQFNALMCQLSTINSTIADLRNDLAACRQDISSLRDENSLLWDRVSYLENRPSPTSLLSEEEVIAESLERLKRGKNVIILGIPEQSPEHDFQYTKKLLLNWILTELTSSVLGSG
ncbi:hypothetical protein JTB14_027287 [Gonioctena quinquepunctata]|nr:hypothetical protein JTB14_027287 [Gonioctena quinquepunctata]